MGSAFGPRPGFQLLILAATLLSGSLGAAPPTESLASLEKKAIEEGSPDWYKLTILYLAERDNPLPAVNAKVIDAVDSLRTDKAIGSSVRSGGATDLSSKPGITDLLALAIERGAVTKKQSGDTLTLNSNPYNLVSLAVGNSPWNQSRLEYLSNVSFSASFATSDLKQDSDFKTFEGSEVKWVVAGNRSAYQRVAANLAAIQEKFAASSAEWDTGCQPALTMLQAAAWAKRISAMDASLNAISTPTTQALHKVLEGVLKDVRLSKTEASSIRACAAVTGDTGAAIDDFIAGLPKQGPMQLSLVWQFQRETTKSDFNSYRLQVSADAAPKFTLNLNATLDMNVHRVGADGTTLPRIRSYSGDLGLTFGKSKGILDGTLALKVKQLQDDSVGTDSLGMPKVEDATLWQVQARLNLSAGDTFRIPVAATWSSTTTSDSDKGWSFSVGLAAVLDALVPKVAK